MHAAVRRRSGPGCIPLEFFLFALVLGMVAFSHASTLATALWGALAIALYKLVFSRFAEGAGLAGLLGHVHAEWVGLANLLALLLGFALLAPAISKRAACRPSCPTTCRTAGPAR